MNTGEIWAKINGHNDVYYISNLGRVKSIRTVNANLHRGRKTYIKETIIKGAISKLGYMRITLYSGGRGSGATVSVHRLVAIAFIQNPENRAQVNHKNGIKTDNNVNNLEWATASENAIHSYKIGLQSYSNQHDKLVLDLETGIYYNTAKEAALAKGFVKSTLTHRLNGRLVNNTGLVYA